jgi:hypothetical protein
VSDFWICPDEGKEYILRILFTQDRSIEDYRLMQFIGGGPVDDDSVFSDFTIASYVGYSTITITGADWDAVVVTGHVAAVSKTVDPAFACTSGSPQTVNGLLLVGVDSDIIYLGVNYSTPIVMAPATTDTVTPLKVQDKTFV